jgi:hypothetical protein
MIEILFDLLLFLLVIAAIVLGVVLVLVVVGSVILIVMLKRRRAQRQPYSELTSTPQSPTPSSNQKRDIILKELTSNSRRFDE